MVSSDPGAHADAAGQRAKYQQLARRPNAFRSPGVMAALPQPVIFGLDQNLQDLSIVGAEAYMEAVDGATRSTQVVQIGQMF